MKKLLVILFLLITSPALAYNTWYVRTDGSTATNCTGLTDAAYPGSGTAQACAFNHPNWAIGIYGDPTAYVSKLQGGDTLIIDGSYKIGCQNSTNCLSASVNITQTARCYPSWTDKCSFDAIASGPDATHPTRILGKGWDTNCSSKAELWSEFYTYTGLNLTDASNVEIQCLELTDHSTSNSGLMYRGIYAEDSSNVLIKNVSMHGLKKGIMAGRLSDWTLRNVDILRNDSVGWDGDIGHTAPNDSSNSGTMAFENVNIQYNGCRETYPGNLPDRCCSQSQGCYGDGLGTYATGGNWTFTNVNFSHNTSDGLDLLYHTGAVGSSIQIKNSRFEGNAGNPLKLAARTDIVENSIVIANCGYFEGQSFTSTTHISSGVPTAFNNCRAGAQAFALILKEGSQHKIQNSTVLGDGGILIYTQGSECNGTEKILSRNNIFVGGPKFMYAGEDTTLFWPGGSDGNGTGTCGFWEQFDNDYGIEWDTKYGCTGTATYQCEVDPVFVDTTGLGFYTGAGQNVNLQVTSPAIDEGDETVTCSYGDCAKDYNYFPRGESYDLGSLEYGSTPPQPSCPANPILCETAEDCSSNGWFWQLNNTCSDTIDPCIDDPINCLTQAYCEAASYYWWSTNTCNSTEEPVVTTCADDCTLCTSVNCVSTGPSCFLQLSGTPICEATIDPCNNACAGCTDSTDCGNSTFAGGCFWWDTNVCKAVAQSCNTNCLDCSSSETCAGSTFGCSWDGTACSENDPCDYDCTDCSAVNCLSSIQRCFLWSDSSCNSTTEQQVTPEGYENLGTYTEADPGSNVSIVNDILTVSNLGHNTDTSVGKDFGAEYFPDFIHRFRISIQSCTASTEDAGATVWAVTATPSASSYELEEVNKDGIELSFSCLSESSNHIRWLLYAADSARFDFYEDIAFPMTRYIQIDRFGLNLTASIYSDSTYSTLVYKLSLEQLSNPAYRYFYPLLAYNDSVTGTSLSFVTSNINLGGESPFYTNTYRGTWKLQ